MYIVSIISPICCCILLKVMRRSATQTRQAEDLQPVIDTSSEEGEGAESIARGDGTLVEDEKALLILDTSSVHPPSVEGEEKERCTQACNEGSEKVSAEPPLVSGTISSATDPVDSGQATPEDRCELVSSAVLHEAVDSERVFPMDDQSAVSSTLPTVDAGISSALTEHQWIQETLCDSDGSSGETDVIQFPETETVITSGTSEEQLVVVGGTIFAQRTV